MDNMQEEIYSFMIRNGYTSRHNVMRIGHIVSHLAKSSTNPDSHNDILARQAYMALLELEKIGKVENVNKVSPSVDINVAEKVSGWIALK